jgi:HEPN domain-containing protein
LAMNRIDFQQLAELRLKEAETLLAAELPDGAYYLSGYAVECALKACIAKRTREHDFPEKKLVVDSHTHDIGNLLRLAELSDQLKIDIGLNVISETFWETVQRWSEQSRYELIEGDDVFRFLKAKLMITAVKSEKGGVLPWIKQYW